MKTFFVLIMITFMSLSIISKISPQQKLLSHPEIKSYIDHLENIRTNPDGYKNIKNMLPEDIKKVASMMYKAYDRDYVGLINFSSEKNMEWERENANRLKRGELVTTQKFGFVEKSLWDKIENTMGKRKLILIRVPFLVKVKIENIQDTKYHNIAAQVVIKAKVIDILKGDNDLSIDDNIGFYYMKGWRLTNYNFQIGETVFVAVEPRSEGNALVIYNDRSENPDNSYGRYPIQNGILIDRNNAWGYGKNISWEDFKVFIKQDINNIILGR